MKILGIETSCDETAAAVIQNGKHILSNVIASSLEQHKPYGGIIPEIASRRQIELINLVVKRALEKAKVALKDIDAIAVTDSPGLVGSLLIGVSFARALSAATRKPLVYVDHIKAHLYANFLSSKQPQLPAIGLVVSGGHSSIFHVDKSYRYRLLGQTRDDAAGEAFDKVARILNLGYPGGPIIDRLAKTGHNKKVRFPYAQLPDSFDFSFSGVKTAVLYFTKDRWDKKRIAVNEIAYSFQESIVSALTHKCVEACQKKHIHTLIIGGGVAANSALRNRLDQLGKSNNINVFFPALSLCMDNAAMIAGLGYHLFTRTGKEKT